MSTTRPASEIIASPEIFIAAAAERTRYIRLGTGVISLSYHNPLWVAERMVLLDHLTRGRVMLGVGPGSLPTDSAMIGLNPTDTRELLEENLDIVMRLLRGDEPVTAETRTHKLIDARLHLRPYSDPLFDVAVAAVASPTGPRLAGRHGLGLLSIGATLTAGGLRRAGPPLERDGGARGDASARPSTGEVAAGRADARRRDPRAGLQGRRVRDRAVVPATSRRSPRSRRWPSRAATCKEMIDFVNEAGIGAIGTVEDAAAQVEQLVRPVTAASAPCCCWPTSGPTRRRPGAPGS